MSVATPSSEVLLDTTGKPLPPSVMRLAQLVHDRRELTPKMARDLVIQANVQEDELMPWADFDHPIIDGYGRKLVYHGGFFEIMVMSWAPGDYSSIHDHGTAQWGAVKVFGAAEHAVFTVKDGAMTTKIRNRQAPGEVNPVTHELIHQMGNVTDQPFISMHMYGCPNPEGDITEDSRIYDFYEGKVQLTTGGVFFCLPESDISERLDECPRPDYATWLRHHTEMLARLKRILKAQTDASLTAKAQELQAELFDEASMARMQNAINALCNDDGTIADAFAWDQLWSEIEAARRVLAMA
jgi:hypothetical protein